MEVGGPRDQRTVNLRKRPLEARKGDGPLPVDLHPKYYERLVLTCVYVWLTSSVCTRSLMALYDFGDKTFVYQTRAK